MLAFLPHHPAEHVLEVDAHGLHALRGEHLEGRHAVFGDFELDFVLLEHSVTQRSFEGPPPLLERCFHRRGRTHDEQIEEAVLRGAFGTHRNLRHPLHPNQLDGGIEQIADDGFHVAAHIAHLGELGGLDLEKGRPGEPGETARDLGLADPSGTDHDDVLGRDLFSQIGRQLLAAPTISQRHRHRPLGRILADDEPIELDHGLSGGQIVQFHAFSSSIVIRSFV